MEDICEICKHYPAKIRVGNHSYCFDCHNKMALHDMGIEDTFTYAKNVSVKEDDGTIHTFEIEHLVHRRIVRWEAIEKDGGYHFELISHVEDDGTAAARQLYRKIAEGVRAKTLMELKGEWGISYFLKSKGNIAIIEDEDRDFNTAIEIDGKKFTPEEFAELIKGYAGFQMQFQIRNASDQLLGENEYLVPIEITKQGLVEELEAALAVTTDCGGFLSQKNISAFDELFDKILHKLKVLDDALEREKAQDCGRVIAKRLREVKHDDDWFPEVDIQMICQIVDPYGIDEELQRYLKNDEKYSEVLN